MILKKFYGKNIKEARKKAFDKLGRDCIILESKQASGDQNACLTVMLDNKKEDMLKHPSERTRTTEANGTYSRRDVVPNTLDKIKEAVAEGFEQFSSDIGLKKKRNGNPRSKTTTSGKNLTMSRRSTPVHKPDQKQDEASDFQQRVTNNLNGSPVSKEVKALHRRFDQMEKLLSDALISANVKYVSHPAFQQLLNAGVQTTAVSAWFEKILNKGIDPYDQSKSFMFELANIVRSELSFALPEAPEKNIMFVGPSGSGKTSLIMKLATNPDFMLDKNVALVSIEPKNGFKQYSPLKPFAEDEELPFFTVEDGVGMSSLQTDLAKFDHVLYDTLSISLQQQAAFRDFWQIRQILSSVKPLEVHYAVNATLEQYYFKESYATNHPLQPDYIAITHLDETDKWGHLIPFVNGLGAGVRYVSRGPNIPDNLNTFKPEWFAEKILSNS